MTTAVKAQVASTSTSDSRATLELLDLDQVSISVVGALAENPAQSRFGNTRLNVTARQMAVDAQANVYAITLSGLTVVPLTPSGPTRPQILTGASAVLNATDGSRNIKPGAFISISGSNFGSSIVADQLPAPTVLGGACVTLSEWTLPLLEVGASRIVAQIPGDLTPGAYVMRVRSLATGQQSDAMIVNLQ